MRVGVAVVSVAAAVALSVAARAQEPAAPGPEVLREQIQYRPFTIRIFGPSDLYWQSRIEFTRGKKWSSNTRWTNRGGAQAVCDRPRH